MAHVYPDHRSWKTVVSVWVIGLSAWLGMVTWSPPISAVTPEDRLPQGCSLSEVYELVQGFLAAISAGDTASLRRYLPDHDGDPAIPDPDTFSWYTVTTDDPGNFGTFHLAELYAYVQQRHRQNEHLTLLALRVMETEQPTTEVGITYDLLRTAEDLPSAVAMQGKGQINCASGTIFVWAMGVTDQGSQATAPASPVAPSPVLEPEVVLLYALRQHQMIPVSTTAVAPSVEVMFPAAASLLLVKLYGVLLAEPATVVIVRPVPDDVTGTPPSGLEPDTPSADEWYIGADLAVWYAGGDPVVQRFLTDVIRRDG